MLEFPKVVDAFLQLKPLYQVRQRGQLPPPHPPAEGVPAPLPGLLRPFRDAALPLASIPLLPGGPLVAFPLPLFSALPHCATPTSSQVTHTPITPRRISAPCPPPLSPPSLTSQAAIADITKRMGAGMADFIEKEVVTLDDFDLYCHYVAGLVGIGLSQLFASSGLEPEAFRAMDELSNCMGLFLQKTNIIRDYLEDIEEEPAPRMFWPRDVWSKCARGAVCPRRDHRWREPRPWEPLAGARTPATCAPTRTHLRPLPLPRPPSLAPRRPPLQVRRRARGVQGAPAWALTSNKPPLPPLPPPPPHAGKSDGAWGALPPQLRRETGWHSGPRCAAPRCACVCACARSRLCAAHSGRCVAPPCGMSLSRRGEAAAQHLNAPLRRPQEPENSADAVMCLNDLARFPPPPPPSPRP